MRKTNHLSLDYGSMRLVRRRNNPNQETLIYIPLSHVTLIQAYQPELQNHTNELYISILL